MTNVETRQLTDLVKGPDQDVDVHASPVFANLEKQAEEESLGVKLEEVQQADDLQPRDSFADFQRAETDLQRQDTQPVATELDPQLLGPS